MKAILTIAFLLAALTANAAQLKSHPHTKPVLKSPKHASEQQNLAMVKGVKSVVKAVPLQYKLDWEAVPGVVYDVEFRPDLAASWVNIGASVLPPFPIATSGTQGYWRVGAHYP
jgi:hypothetical protein